MKITSILLVIIAGIMWAGSGLAAQDFFTKSSIDSMELTVFRMISAGCIMMLLTAVKGRLSHNLKVMKEHPALWLSLIFYGNVGLMFMHYTYFASIAAGNAAAATVIQYTAPAMVIIWMSFVHKSLPTKGEVMAVISSMVGVVLLVTGGDLSKLSVPWDCVYLGFLSGIFFAVCCVYPKRFIGTLDNTFVLSVGMFSGAVVANFITPLPPISGFINSIVIMDIFWIVICGTVVAFTCYNMGLKWLSEEQASLTATVEPAASVIASVFLFDVTFDWMQGIGILLVLFAIAATAFVKKKDPEIHLEA